MIIWRVRKAPARVARAHQIVAARAARAARREPVGNITDPESRLQPLAGGGWLQGYNAQAVTTGDGLVLATQVSNNPADQIAFIPMMQAATAIGRRVGGGPIGLVLADAGYLSVDNLTVAGPDRLIAVGTRRTLEAAAQTAARRPAEPGSGGRPRDPGDAGPVGHPRRHRRLPATRPDRRNHLRPCQTQPGLPQFTGIGLDRARAEWMFHGAVHNLSKIINHTLTAVQQTG